MRFPQELRQKNSETSPLKLLFVLSSCDMPSSPSLGVYDMFSFHTLLLTEAVGETLIVAPRADGIGFRYTDLQAELNRILRVYDSPQTEAPIRNLVVDGRSGGGATISPR